MYQNRSSFESLLFCLFRTQRHLKTDQPSRYTFLQAKARVCLCFCLLPHSIVGASRKCNRVVLKTTCFLVFTASSCYTCWHNLYVFVSGKHREVWSVTAPLYISSQGDGCTRHSNLIALGAFLCGKVGSITGYTTWKRPVAVDMMLLQNTALLCTSRNLGLEQD